MTISGRSTAVVTLVCVLSISIASAKSPDQQSIPAGAKIFIEQDAFGTFITAAITKKKVPLTVVAEEAAADYVITATSESQKAGWARTLALGQTGSNEEAAVTLIDAKTKAVLWAYAVHKRNSIHGKQSAAEACAKHLKDIVRH